MVDDAASSIERYLANPPYFGRSGFGDREKVKRLCGDGAERVFDSSRKLWGTRNAQNLGRLITSRAWTPVGIDAARAGALVRRAHQRHEEAEAAKAVEAAAKEAAKEAAKAAAAQAAAAKREAATQAKAVAKREAAKASTKAPTKAPTKALVKATTAAPAPAAARGIPPTAHEVAECARLGYTSEAIAYSDILIELGPRGTLSHEGRLLRWCEALTSDARHDVWAQNPDDYFRTAVWLPAAEELHVRHAHALNERAAQAAWRD